MANSALFLFLLYLSTLYISYLIQKLQTKMDRQVLLCLIKQEIDWVTGIRFDWSFGACVWVIYTISAGYWYYETSEERNYIASGINRPQIVSEDNCLMAL